MMDSRIQGIQSRIQEIQARIAALNPTPPPPPPAVSSPAPILSSSLPANASGGAVHFSAPAPRLFDLKLAEANGKVQLRRLENAPATFAPQVEALIERYAKQNGLQPELVRAVIQQESSGNPKSESVVGAQGLMQLMPETARGLGVRDAFDPEQNIAGGTRYLAGLMREFGNDLPRALAAYNAGPGAVRKAGGVPNFPETQNYVRKIMGMLEKR